MSASKECHAQLKLKNMNPMNVKTTYPKSRIIKDERVFTLEAYFISLEWWMRRGHFNEDLYRKIVKAKNLS